MNPSHGCAQLVRLKVLPNDMALFIVGFNLLLYQIPPMASASDILSLPTSAPFLKWSYNNTVIHNDGERFSRSTRIPQQWDGIPPPPGVSCVISTPAVSDLYTIFIPTDDPASCGRLDARVEVTSLLKSVPCRSSYGRWRGVWAEGTSRTVRSSDVFVYGITAGTDGARLGDPWMRRVLPDAKTTAAGSPEIVLLDEGFVWRWVGELGNRYAFGIFCEFGVPAKCIWSEWFTEFGRSRAI